MAHQSDLPISASTLPAEAEVVNFGASGPEPASGALATSNVLRLRGLPFSASEEDCRDFFQAFTVHAIFICKRNGRATGEAYVQLDSADFATQALQLLNRRSMGHRYIEVFDSSEADMNTAKAMSVDHLKGYVIRARGLPYSASAADVLRFFSEQEVVRGMEGVVFTYTPDGRPTGEAYVEFQTEDGQKEAMKKHKETIGARYIELFVSTKADMLQAIQHNRMILGYANRKRWVAPGTGVPGQLPFGLPTGAPLLYGSHHNTAGGGRGYGSAVDDVAELFASGFNIGLTPQQLQQQRMGASAGLGNPMLYGNHFDQQQQQQQQGDGRLSNGGRGGRGATAQGYNLPASGYNVASPLQDAARGGGNAGRGPAQPQHAHHLQQGQYRQATPPHLQPHLLQQQYAGQYDTRSSAAAFPGASGGSFPGMNNSGSFSHNNGEASGHPAAYFAAAAAVAAASAGGFGGHRSNYYPGSGSANGSNSGAAHFYPNQHAGGASVNHYAPGSFSVGAAGGAAARAIDFQQLPAGLQAIDLSQQLAAGGGNPLQRFEGELHAVAGTNDPNSRRLEFVR